MKNNKANEQQEPVRKDTLFLRVIAEEFKPSTYNGVTITSHLKSDMKIVFNSGDFVKDFNDALAEGHRIMSLGGVEKMYFTSSCDDFLMDSKKYSYVYSTENPDDVIGVKKV